MPDSQNSVEILDPKSAAERPLSKELQQTTWWRARGDATPSSAAGCREGNSVAIDASPAATQVAIDVKKNTLTIVSTYF
jgi:hypothetical protein